MFGVGGRPLQSVQPVAGGDGVIRVLKLQEVRGQEVKADRQLHQEPVINPSLPELPVINPSLPELSATFILYSTAPKVNSYGMRLLRNILVATIH